MKRFLIAMLVCAAVGALVALGLQVVLRDASGFLAENRPAVIGGVAGAASVLVLQVFFPRRRKQ
ncbi:MAG: hypothetical protein JNK02_06625 [Planctomycetes bacterium]|nr:hypothetical protein [Planctomycetota bacterium]